MPKKKLTREELEEISKKLFGQKIDQLIENRLKQQKFRKKRKQKEKK
jgi:hypothetical protein